MQTLLTERLRLRPYQETDFDPFAKLHGDPVLKANTHAKAMNRLQARELFDGYRAAFATSGFGMMSVRHRETDADIGECGLWYREDADAYTLRYTLQAAHWGNGYSLEAVRAVLADAFDAHAFNFIRAIAMHHNQRSVRVLERAGFRQIGNAFRGVKGFLCFELTLQDWKVSGGLPPARGV
jgi:RimJ/RimL family protein N-acetyltransferase